MKKRIILSITAVALSAGISLSHAVESSAQTYADQVALYDEDRRASAIADVEGKLAACQQMESQDCSYHAEILSILSLEEVVTEGVQ